MLQLHKKWSLSGWIKAKWQCRGHKWALLHLLCMSIYQLPTFYILAIASDSPHILPAIPISIIAALMAFLSILAVELLYVE